MGEWNYIILAPLCAALFAIGGTGYKWARRYVMPVCIAAIAMLNGISWYMSALSCVLLIIALCLPYGDSLPHKFRWVIRYLVILSYFAALLPLGLTAFPLITAAVGCSLFYASIRGWLTWKIVELTLGFLIGITAAGILCG